MIILRREPTLLLALLASGIQMVSAFAFPLTEGQQGALNAIAVAVLGVVTAVAVRGDQLAPAILGFAQAALALGLAFGWHLDPTDQSTIMTFVAAAVAMFIRQQVVAPVAPTFTRALAVENQPGAERASQPGALDGR